MQAVKSKVDYDYVEDRQLRRMWFDVAYTMQAMAAEMGRTPYGLSKRAARLGLGPRRQVLSSDTEEESYSRAVLIKMDNEFCRAMKAAIDSGLETSPIGVSTVHGTRFPILSASRNQTPLTCSVANECADA